MWPGEKQEQVERGDEREKTRESGQKTKTKCSESKRVVRKVRSWEWAEAKESSCTEGSLGCVLCREVGKPVKS